MNNPFICYQNLWANGTVIAATTETSQCWAEYTQEDGLQLYWRSTAVDAEQVIDCDLGEAREYDFVGIVGHNLTADATIVLYGADDDAFTVNPVSDTLTWNGNNLWEVLEAARTKRYVRLSLTDTTNPSGYLQVGTVVVGKAQELSRGPVVPDRDGFTNETETEMTPSAAKFTTQERPSLFVKVLPFKGLVDNSQTIIKALLELCAAHRAFAICLDPTSPNTNSYWVYLEDPDLPTRTNMGYWNWTATIRECA